jgi:hypothetical protein
MSPSPGTGGRVRPAFHATFAVIVLAGIGNMVFIALLWPWGGVGRDVEDSLARAQHYREQAAHMRELAAQDQNDETRKALISLAENYDRLCLKYLGLTGQTPS